MVVYKVTFEIRSDKILDFFVGDRENQVRISGLIQSRIRNVIEGYFNKSIQIANLTIEKVK